MPKVDIRQLFTVIGFACLLLLPSFDIPLKYFGLAGMTAYFLLGLLGVLVCYYLILPNLMKMLGERLSLVLLGVTFAVLALIAKIGYPLATSGQFGGGSDMDDALIIGAGEMMSGRYPYYQHTYLGGLLTPMPGAIILAIPFVAANLIQYQNLFWLTAFAVSVRSFLHRTRYALLTIWTVILVSPTFYQVLVTGSDHISNTLYILIPMWLVVSATGASDQKPGRPSQWAPLWAVLLGVGLSSRSNFMLLMPLFLSVLVQTGGWRSAIKYSLIAGVAFLAVTFPFWLYDPAGFTPTAVQGGKLGVLDAVLPGASLLVPLLSLLLAAALAFTRMEPDCAAFFRNCAIVQLFALYLASLIYTAGQPQFTLFMGNAGYGMFSLCFTAASIWIFLSRGGSSKVGV